jgi:hypothetical protein
MMARISRFPTFPSHIGSLNFLPPVFQVFDFKGFGRQWAARVANRGPPPLHACARAHRHIYLLLIPI